jgi:hypothetical protein
LREKANPVLAAMTKDADEMGHFLPEGYVQQENLPVGMWKFSGRVNRKFALQTDARGHVDDVPNVSPMQSGEARSCAFVWTPEFFSYIFFFASKEPPTKNVFNCISTADSSYHDS